MSQTKVKLNYFRFFFTLVFGLFPIYGAIEWGWKFNDMLALYWFEGIVVVADGMLKYWSTHRNFLMADANREGEFLQLSLTDAIKRKFKISVMFLFVIGFFGVLHAALLWNVFFSDSTLNAGDPTQGAQKLFEHVLGSDLMMGIYVSAGMRFLLFFTDFLFRGQHKTPAAATAMAMSVMRLFILHISLIVLGFIFDMFNADAIYLVIAFVGFKALVDAGIAEMNFDSKKEKEAAVE